jgi:hypothetical protein
VLFSNEKIAGFINKNFEPTWESVRSVPTIRIDFGDERIVTRTLHGNVATYACLPDGQVLDILPGIYDPQSYLRQLQELARLHRFVGQSNDAVTSLREYHQRQADANQKSRPREVLVESGGGFSIKGTEQPVKVFLVPATRAAARQAIAQGHDPLADDKPTPNTTEGLDEWKALVDDALVNETTRRQKIHEYLATPSKPVVPATITKWLYREVLHTDLDDPYLGLGKLLFDRYPFASEDDAAGDSPPKRPGEDPNPPR